MSPDERVGLEGLYIERRSSRSTAAVCCRKIYKKNLYKYNSSAWRIGWGSSSLRRRLVDEEKGKKKWKALGTIWWRKTIVVADRQRQSNGHRPHTCVYYPLLICWRPAFSLQSWPIHLIWCRCIVNLKRCAGRWEATAIDSKRRKPFPYSWSSLP